MVKDRKYAEFDEVETFCRDHLESWPTCSYLLSSLIEISEEKNTKDALLEAQFVRSVLLLIFCLIRFTNYSFVRN